MHDGITKFWNEMLSLQSWSIRRSLQRGATLQSVLEKVYGMGYRAIEISERGGASIELFVDKVRAAGLCISGIHLPCLWRTREEELAESIEHHLHTVLRAAPEREIVVSVMGNPRMFASDNRKRTLIQYQRYAELLYVMASTYRYDNVVFAYHLYDFDWMAGEECIGKITDAGLSLAVDTYFLKRAGGTWNDVQRLKDNISSFHINDYDSLSNQKAIGRGDENWQKAFSTMGKCVNCKSIVVEHDSDIEECVSMSAASIKFLFSRPDLADHFISSQRK